MKRNKRQFRRGILLIEILLAIVVVAIAMGILGGALEMAFRSTWQTTAAQDRSARMDAAMRQLRQDIWQSRSADAAATGDSLRIVLEDRLVNWTIRADGSLTRTVDSTNAAEPARMWSDTAANWSFQSGDASVVLVDKSRNAGQVTFVRQLRLDQLEQR